MRPGITYKVRILAEAQRSHFCAVDNELVHLFSHYTDFKDILVGSLLFVFFVVLFSIICKKQLCKELQSSALQHLRLQADARCKSRDVVSCKQRGFFRAFTNGKVVAFNINAVEVVNALKV